MATPTNAPETLNRPTTPEPPLNGHQAADGQQYANVAPAASASPSAKPDQKLAEPAPPSRLLRRTDQVAIAVTALFALAMISGYWFSQAKLRGRLIDIDRTARLTAAFLVDINSADWPELIQLPGMGETLAKRIIEWRTMHGRFATIDQLRQVSGVGPKRLESWRPYIRPIVPVGDQANLPRTEVDN
jgi:competence protein ComEA